MVDYLKFGDDLEREALQIVNQKTLWLPLGKKSGVEVSYKASQHFDGNMFRFVTKVDVPLFYVYDVMKPPHTTAERMSWDDSIAHYEKVRSITPDMMIVRILTKSAMLGAISPREFVDIFYMKTFDDYPNNPEYGKTHWIYAKSVEDSRFPVTKQYVRATNHPLAYGIAEDKTDRNITHMELYVNTDVGGKLPRYLVEGGLPPQQISYIETVKKEAKRRCKISTGR